MEQQQEYFIGIPIQSVKRILVKDDSQLRKYQIWIDWEREFVKHKSARRDWCEFYSQS